MPPSREAYAAEARARAFLLYEGVRTPHRSCGIALAETFGLATPPYQALRRGGITGDGPCGAIAAGLLVLGEILGDPSPTGTVTPELRAAATAYRAAVSAKVDRPVELSCTDRTAPHGPFPGPARAAYCTALASIVAETVAEVLWDVGRPVPIPPLEAS